jgi:ligand-binding SRPBCC domain-containing protein
MQFTSEVWLPVKHDEVFRFFADAGNLEQLTPPWLHFQILTPVPIQIRRGTIIDYRLRLHGFPIRWQSEITAWEPPHRFVDEQRRGPYRRWIHQHEFLAERGGTIVRDSVEYEMPLAVVTRWFVRRDVERIFSYRSRALGARFGQAAINS